MTVIVSVKINDGIVTVSDSASTFTNTQVYDHAEKIVNLIRDLPIGVMVTGDAGIGSESLTTLLGALLARPVVTLVHPRDAGAAAAYVVQHRFRHFQPHAKARDPSPQMR